MSTKEIKLAAIYLKKVIPKAHTRSIFETIEILDQVYDLWRNPNFDYRKESEEVLSLITGQSKNLINYELNEFIGLFKSEATKYYISQQFGDINYLDDWIEKGDILLHAQPRGLILHSLAGNSFVLGPLSLYYGIITKNVNLAKLASSEPYFTIRFVQSINEIDQNLSKELGVVYWRGREKNVYKFLFNEDIIDLVIAWGGMQSIRELKKISATYGVRFIEHGPKFSFSIINKSFLGRSERLTSIAKEIAKDVTIWNQYACCSPRIVFFQEKDFKNFNEGSDDLRSEIFSALNDIKGNTSRTESKTIVDNKADLLSVMTESMQTLRKNITYDSALGFAKLLALELNDVSKMFARTKMTESEVINTLNKRDYYLLNIESKGWGRIFRPADSSLKQNPDWTVVYLRRTPSKRDIDACVNRFIIVTSYKNFEEIMKWIEEMKIQRFIQTFSIIGDMEEVKEISDQLSLIGACTITLPGQMNAHKSSAPHDGDYDLKELVRWVSINFSNKNLKEF